MPTMYSAAIITTRAILVQELHDIKEGLELSDFKSAENLIALEKEAESSKTREVYYIICRS